MFGGDTGWDLEGFWFESQLQTKELGSGSVAADKRVPWTHVSVPNPEMMRTHVQAAASSASKEGDFLSV